MTEVERKLKLIYIQLYNKIRYRAESLVLNCKSINALYTYQKYFEYLNFLSAQLVKLGEREIEIMSPTLIEAYEKGREIIGTRNQFFSVPDINTVWADDGLRFSDRIWLDKEILREKLETGVVDIISRGATTDDLNRELQKSLGTSYFNAQRLIRTETQAQEISGALSKLREEGIEQYKIIGAVDKRTCKDCKNMNGKIFNVADAIMGTNCPPLHPQCRCSIQAVIK